MKILVTGAGGFVGNFLVKKLLERGHLVAAMGINNGDFLKAYGIPVHEVDILNLPTIKQCLKEEQPDAIIHLAAQSNIPISWDNPVMTVDVNVNGTINILQAMADVCPKAKFLNVGSSDEYGLTAKSGVMLTEEMLCRPQNPYAITKLCAEQMVMQLGARNSLRVIHARSFNHFGPGQRVGFVVSDFCQQIVMFEKCGIEPILRVGDLSACRDFLFVDDVVLAYTLLIETEASGGVYNICSGIARSIQSVMEILISLAKVSVRVEIDQSKIRPVDVPYFVGDSAKLTAETGWKPECEFVESLKETLDWWRTVSDK